MFFRRLFKFQTALLAEYAIANLGYGTDAKHPVYKAIFKYYRQGEIEQNELRSLLLEHNEIQEIIHRFPVDIDLSIRNERTWNSDIEIHKKTKDRWGEFLSNSSWFSNDANNTFIFDGFEISLKKTFLSLFSENGIYYALVYSYFKNEHCFISVGGDLHSIECVSPPLELVPPDVPVFPESSSPTLSKDEFFLLSQICDSDNEQKQAISSDSNKHVVILAGAGSGKTRTLVNRLAYLHLVDKIPLSRISLLTFTNNAANEMRARGEKIIKDLYQKYDSFDTPSINAQTIDSLFYNLIKTYWANLGFDREPVFYLDDDESNNEKLNLLKQTIHEDFVGDIFKWYMEDEKRLRWLMRDLDNHARGITVNRPGISELLLLFLQKQIQNNVILGFHYMTLIIRDTLTKYPSLCDVISDRYSHILIDEFQDIDRLQFSVFTILFKSNKIYFTFVGDDDQSIYVWRGADNTIIKEISQNPDVSTVNLKTNYRNNPYIVKAGNDVLRIIKDRAKETDIIPHRTYGAKIRHSVYDNTYQNLTNEINKLINSGICPEKIAVLTRDNSSKKDISVALRASKIPVNYSTTSTSITDNYRLVKSILNIWTDNELISSSKELKRLLNSPQGRKEIELREALYGNVNKMEDDLILLKTLYSVLLEKPLFVEDVISRISIILGEKYDITINEKLSDNCITAFELFCKNCNAEWPIGVDQLNSIFKTFESDIKREARAAKHSSPGIQLNTIHQSKGLEFDVVFITGLSKGNYPNTKRIDDEYERKLKELNALRGAQKNYLLLKEAINNDTISSIASQVKNIDYDIIDKQYLQLFISDLTESSNDITEFNADGIQSYIDTYLDNIKPIIKQYSNNIGRLEFECKRIERSILAVKERLVLLQQNESPDADALSSLEEVKSQLSILLNEHQENSKTLLEFKNTHLRFINSISLCSEMFQRCIEAKSLLEAVAKEKRLFEIKEELLKVKEKQENEEKRTFYVALTRAKDILYLCHEQNLDASSFIEIINSQYIEQYKMLTRAQDLEIQKLKEKLRSDTARRAPENNITTAINEIIAFEPTIKKRLEDKRNQYFLENKDFMMLQPLELIYFNRAISLQLLTEITGLEFCVEIVHSLQRISEERLLSAAGQDAQVYKTSNINEINVIANEMIEIMKKGETPPPHVNFFRDIFYQHEDAPYTLKKVKDLKKSGVVHYYTRKNSDKLPEDIQKTWNIKIFYGEITPNMFLIATKELSNIRNKLIHRNEDSWPEDPIPKAFNYMEIILRATPYIQ